MRLLTSGTVARQLGLSRERVAQLEREGRLPAAVRDSTGRRLFTEADVEALRRARAGAGVEAPTEAPQEALAGA
jgi:DNA-binding transcriptional MerR regulator